MDLSKEYHKFGKARICHILSQYPGRIYPEDFPGEYLVRKITPQILASIYQVREENKLGFFKSTNSVSLSQPLMLNVCIKV